MIPDEAVEAAAKALHGKAPRRNNWENASEDYREGYRHYAKVALAAAAPHLEPRHTKTDPACTHYKEAGPFRRYLNERGRGNSCHVCVPVRDERADIWDEGWGAPGYAVNPYREAEK